MLAGFTNRVSVEQAGADVFSATAALKIQRQHVRRFYRARRRKAGTDRFASAGESREVMKAHPARHDHFRELFQRAIHFDGFSTFHRADLNQLRRIIRIVVDGANALGNE